MPELTIYLCLRIRSKKRSLGTDGYDCPAYQAWGRAVYNPRWNELMEQGVKLTGENADVLLPHPPKNICAPSE